MGAATYNLSCDCGAVSLTVQGEPTLTLYCHCGSCRSLYNLDILSATAWSEEAVTLPPSEAVYEYRLPNKQMKRWGCPQCGTIMYGRHRPGVPVIPNARFRAANGGELPAELEPQLHLFYAERVLDVADDLPKSERGEKAGLDG